jgi:hypothetical protein
VAESDGASDLKQGLVGLGLAVIRLAALALDDDASAFPWLGMDTYIYQHGCRKKSGDPVSAAPG